MLEASQYDHLRRRIDDYDTLVATTRQRYGCNMPSAVRALTTLHGDRPPSAEDRSQVLEYEFLHHQPQEVALRCDEANCVTTEFGLRLGVIATQSAPVLNGRSRKECRVTVLGINRCI